MCNVVQIGHVALGELHVHHGAEHLQDLAFHCGGGRHGENLRFNRLGSECSLRASIRASSDGLGAADPVRFERMLVLACARIREITSERFRAAVFRA